MTVIHSQSRTRRICLRAAAPVAALGLALVSAPGAFAASGSVGPAPVATPSTAELADASAAAKDDQAVAGLARFFAHLDARAAGHKGLAPHAEKAPGAASQHPRLSGGAQAVYTLNPAFVRGSQAAPVAKFAFAAVKATSAHGRTASVWLGKDKKTGRWQVINTLSGADEAAYPRQGKGDLVFTEPQTKAWYKVGNGTVRPLNDAARAEVGGQGTSLAAYRKTVHERYGDKLSGSAYQKSGKLGGFPVGTASAAATGEGGGASHHAAAGVAAGSAGAAVAAAGGTWLIRRRRRVAD